MSVTITLHVFSGRPNPTWELSEDQAGDLSNQLNGLDKTTLLKPPGILGGLGYQGFSIQAVREKNFDPYIYIHSGIVDLDRFLPNMFTGNTSIENWLISTSPGNVLDSDLRSYVESELQKPSSLLDDPKLSFSFFTVPRYDPGKWNNDQNILYKNNCYNYANDKITYTFAQPGRGSGEEGPFPPTCTKTGLASERDGQKPTDSALSSPTEGHFIALVVWPGYDYHWYRLDDNGKWSHKPGSTPATNKDNSNNLITDPKNCDRGPYSEFCGYYYCNPSKTKIV